VSGQQQEMKQEPEAGAYRFAAAGDRPDEPREVLIVVNDQPVDLPTTLPASQPSTQPSVAPGAAG